MKTVHVVEVGYTKVVEYFVGHSLTKVKDFWTFRLGNMNFRTLHYSCVESRGKKNLGISLKGINIALSSRYKGAKNSCR